MQAAIEIRSAGRCVYSEFRRTPFNKFSVRPFEDIFSISETAYSEVDVHLFFLQELVERFLSLSLDNEYPITVLIGIDKSGIELSLCRSCLISQ